jgi:hypothetical protein
MSPAAIVRRGVALMDRSGVSSGSLLLNLLLLSVGLLRPTASG